MAGAGRRLHHEVAAELAVLHEQHTLSLSPLGPNGRSTSLFTSRCHGFSKTSIDLAVVCFTGMYEAKDDELRVISFKLKFFVISS